MFEVDCLFGTEHFQTDIADVEFFGEEVYRFAHSALKIEANFFILFELEELPNLFAHGKDGEELANHIILFDILGDASCCVGDLTQDGVVAYYIDHYFFSFVLERNIPLNFLTTYNAHPPLVAPLSFLQDHPEGVRERSIP